MTVGPVQVSLPAPRAFSMTVITAPENTPEAWSILAEAHEDPWTACGWSFEGQRRRFESVLMELAPQPGDRFLDWGCGTGELSEYVSERVDYVGFDFAPGMVDSARRDHPGRRFQTWEPLGNFDLIACVGPFNLPDHWSKEATWHMLRRLFDRTKSRLVASLYAGEDESCIRYSVVECERFANGQGYHSNAWRWRGNDILMVLER